MFRFTDDCIIGIEEIDNEHRHLFSLVEKGTKLLQNEHLLDHYEEMKELLDEFEDYADQHFAHEEAYMQQICDPELVIQQIQHNCFRDVLSNWSFADISGEDQQREALEELMLFMARWLYRHIIGSDIMIGKLPPLEDWMMRENPCEFTDEYLTGNKFIDSEHRELFSIIEEAYKLVKAGAEDNMDEIKDTLLKLGAYAIEHFRDEEAYMERIGYEGLEAQRYAHEAFIYRLESMELIDVSDYPQKNMEELIYFLLGWMIHHIQNSDKNIPQM